MRASDPRAALESYDRAASLNPLSVDPLLGGGFNNYGHHFLRYQHTVPGRTRLYAFPRSPHSSHMRFLTDLGVLGFTLWLAALGATVRVLMKAWRATAARDAPQHFLLVRALTLGMLLQIVYAFADDVLNGITRRAIMTIAADAGYEVVERRIDRSELYLADEVFLTGTGVQVAPIASIDDRPIGAEGFPVSLDIQRRYFAAVRGTDPRYASWLTPIT